MNFKHILLYIFSLLLFFGLGMCNRSSDKEITTEILFAAEPPPAETGELETLISKRLDKAGVKANDLLVEKIDSKLFRLTFRGKESNADLPQLLETTGKLTVYSTWNNSEIFSYLSKINNLLSQMLYKRDSIEAEGNVYIDTNARGKPDSTTIHGRKVRRSNGLFDIVQPATTTENGKINLKSGPVIGYIMPMDTQILSKVLQMKEIKDSVPQGLKPALSNISRNNEQVAFELLALRNEGPTKGIVIKAEDIRDVEVRKPENKKDVTEVKIKLKKEKSRELRQLYKAYPESHMAIATDETVVYYWHPSNNNEFTTISIVVDDKAGNAKEIAAIIENPMPFNILVHSISQ